MTPCQCHVCVMSDLGHLESRCNTQTFELAVMGKNLFVVNNFVFGVCSIYKTRTTCECHVCVMSDLRHLESRCNTQTFDFAVMGKNLFVGFEQFCIRGCVRFTRLGQPVSAMCVSCQI